MEDLTILTKNRITSLELLEQINFFREQEGKAKTNHKDLLIIIETEFTNINRKRVKGGMCPETDTQIKEQLQNEKIEITKYINSQNNQEYKMYILPTEKAKQCLLKESKFVRRAVIKYIEQLEQQIKAKEIESQNKQILDIENRLKALENKEKENKIINNGFMTVSEYAKSIGAYVPPFFCACLGKMATEKCVKNHIIIGKMYHSKYGSVNIYPVDLLESVFKDARIIIDYSEDEEIDF